MARRGRVISRGIPLRRAFPALVVFLAAVLFLLVWYSYFRSVEPRSGYESIGLDPLQGPKAHDGDDEVQPLEGRGPNGEPPASIDDVVRLLAKGDIRRVREGRFKAAVCMQDIQNDWSRLQVRSIRTTLEAYGVEILVVTDGEFDIEKQIADYEHVIRMKPDIIITIPLDTNRCAAVLRTAADRGIKLVFIDTVPEGFVHPRDYAGMVIADSYANGRVGAEVIAERLGGRGRVALLHWRNRMFTCDQRSLAARETFARYGGIEVVAQEYFGGVYDVREMTAGILERYPGLDALWVVWDTPAMEAVDVIGEKGRDVIVATVDLGYDVARAIAEGNIVVATGAQHPFDQGAAEAMIAVAALAGKVPPAYVVVPAEKVTRSSLERAWRRVYHEEIPVEIGMKLR